MENKELKQLQKKIQALGDISEDQRNKIICSLIGHSRIMEYCFGSQFCGRCGEQLGDFLLGEWVEDNDCVYVMGKNDETIKNFKNLNWKDKLYVRDPFTDSYEQYKKSDYLLEFKHEKK